MKALKMCLNWKVLVTASLFAGGIFVFAPDYALAAFPFLVIAICPLSMVLMMTMMNDDRAGRAGPTEADGLPTGSSRAPVEFGPATQGR